MDSVAFLQQQINEVQRQIDQLNDRKRQLYTDLWDQRVIDALQKNNLPNSDVQV